jgi:hypothetical protein
VQLKVFLIQVPSCSIPISWRNPRNPLPSRHRDSHAPDSSPHLCSHPANWPWSGSTYGCLPRCLNKGWSTADQIAMNTYIIYMEVSINGGTPKWIVYNGISD